MVQCIGPLNPISCSDHHSLLLVKHNICPGCVSFGEVAMQYLKLIILPFIIFYIFYGIFEMFTHKKDTAKLSGHN